MQVFKIPESLKKGVKYTFCPGCDHGVAIRLVAELLDEMNLKEDTILASSIGCSVFLYDFLDVDTIDVGVPVLRVVDEHVFQLLWEGVFEERRLEG